MKRRAEPRADEFGFKKSSGVDYSKLEDRQMDDERFQRQRALREGSAPAPPVTSGPKAGSQSATMDAVMRMLTGKEERTIADRISDPNRPTWEQYKKENADKLDLTDNGAREMREYRKKLDAAREKALAKRSSSKKSKKHKRSYSSSSGSSGSESDSEDKSRRRSSSKKSRRKAKKSRKRRRTSSSDSDESADDSTDSSESERDDDRGRKSRKQSRRKSSSKKSKKKSHKKDKKRSKDTGDRSPSPVRLSSFLQGSDSD